MKDKKFKSVNRDENYAKVDTPDMRLGRQSVVDKPQQSPSRKMKKYMARQPTADNKNSLDTSDYSSKNASQVKYENSADYSDSLDSNIFMTEPSVQETLDMQSDFETQSDTEYQVQSNNTDAVHNDKSPTMAQHKNRAYREHTPFSQKRTDYDFTKDNQSTDYNFTDNQDQYTLDNTEQDDIPSDESPQIHFEKTVEDIPQQRKPKKRYYRNRGRQGKAEKSKNVDYDISVSSRNEEYNFKSQNSDIPFERTKTDCSENSYVEPVKNNKHKSAKQSEIKDLSDNQSNITADTHRESAEQLPDEDYNISDSAENSDTAFDRVKSSGNAEPVPTVKHKKNKRLRQKHRLKTDYTVKNESVNNLDGDSTDNGNLDNANSDNTQKDFQFKREEKAEFKAKKARAKSEKAEDKLPHRKKLKRQRLYDEEKGKPKSRLKFENEVKPQKDLYHRSPVKAAMSAAAVQLAYKAHSKVGEVEHENSAVEGAHKAERVGETLSRYSLRTAGYIRQNKKAAPYKRAQKLKFKAQKAEAKAAYEKTVAENPELRKSALKRFRQKQQIKKQYQKARNAEYSAKAAKKTVEETKKITACIIEFVKHHSKAVAVVLILTLLIGWTATSFSSCAVMGTAGINSILTSSFLAEDEDIYLAEGYYSGLESDLQSELDDIETTYSGYDEYKYNLAQIGHNPYELTSYLTAKYECFVFSDIQSELDNLFSQQYILTITDDIEIRTDDEGNEYEYKILNVTLTNTTLNTLADTTLTDGQKELYGIYLETKGNRDYLFADDIYSNEVTPPTYTIPGEALSDSTFRTLIIEAEKYLGMPYVWGGSSPSTSFDCSGFVCWVFKNSGVYPLERTTAQGIYNQCSIIPKSDAKPGDIIFFTGTYNAGEPVTHVGIYVGENMMIHCGNPIQYTSIESSYWTEHFYAFGRLN